MEIGEHTPGQCDVEVCNRYADWKLLFKDGTQLVLCDDHMCDVVDEYSNDIDLCGLEVDDVVLKMPLHRSDQFNLEISPF